MSEQDRLVKVQSLIVGVLRDLMRSRIAETDDAINAAISRIGSFCNRDRAYVFAIEGDRTSNSHEWCADGIASHIDDLQDMPVEIFGEVGEKLFRGEIFHVPDMSDLPETSKARQIFEMQGIKSIVMVPMMEDGELRGLVGFDAVERTHAFTPDELDLLQSVADVISTAIMRRDRKRREERTQRELESERAFLKTVLESSAMGIAVTDGKGTVRYINDAAGSLIGKPASEVIGKHYLDPSLGGRTEEGTPVTVEESLLAKVAATGATTEPVIRRLELPDATRFIRTQAAPVLSGESKLARVVITLSEVTSLIEAKREMERAMEEARRANAAKSSFLARMSHELRTPLNGVIGVADLLGHELTDEGHRGLIGMMRESGALLLDIINDLLDLSKIEAEMIVLRRRRINLAEIAERACATHRLAAKKKGVTFILQVSGRDRATRVGDDKRIAQILHNVIGNAVKFTAKGSISVHLDCTDSQRVSIRVTDTGIGISEEDIGTIFDDFVQADLESIYAHGGTGLGLPISKRLVEMMGGQISVSSTLGRGSTFAIDLDLREPREIKQELMGLEADPGGETTISLKGQRVLLADDSPTNCVIMATMLERLRAEVTVVDDGAQAYEAWTHGEFDMVVLDISMPVLTGIEAMRAITASARGSGRNIPTFIAFTAHAMEHQIDSYIEAGFDEVITKPVTVSALEDCLGSMGYPQVPMADA